MPIRDDTGAGPRQGVAAMSLLAGLVLCSGCGMTQGKLLWAMGVGSGQKVPAEFELTRHGPVLVLVDDSEERLDSPATRSELAQKVGRLLKEHNAVAQLVPQKALDRLRRKHPDFEERGCREVGRMTEAHQVVWIDVRDMYARAEVDETIHAARMSVTVKVIDALTETRGEERLWPVQHEGHIVSTELHANEVLRAKTPPAIAAKLTDRAAEQVARLFYEYPLEEE